jgi:L-amino acid N-acyltransferase YncA
MLISAKETPMNDEEIWTRLARYRQVKALPDGQRVLVRPLGKDDTECLADMFARANLEDTRAFRSGPVTHEVVERWVRNLNLRKVFPMVVVANQRIVADATLHFGENYQRHIAWVRLFLDSEFRQRGIGMLLIRSMVDIARNLGLHQLIALVPTEYPNVIRGYEDMGFKNEFTHRNYAIWHDGRLSDMDELVLYLVEHTGEF